MKKAFVSILFALFIIANVQAQKRLKPITDPIVILNFDDAEESHYINVAPLLKKFNFGATFMVCEMAVRPPADSTYYMNWKQIKELYDMGFEIGNHTGHHKNMTAMSDAEKRKEVAYIEDKCKTYGIPKPISFAYPGQRIDSASQAVLKQMGYHFARTGNSRYYDSAHDAPLAIPSYTMGSTEKLRSRTIEALQNLKSGQILVFTIHGVPDPVHDGYTTSVEVFTKYLEFMRDHHFKMIAMRDLAEYVKY